MNNPLEILRALDKNLDHKISLVLFGKAAIALGFQHPPEGSDQTMDVDSILTNGLPDGISNDMAFWESLETTNQDLAPSGLYRTHLFEEEQVILSPDWLAKTVPIELGLPNIRVLRPSALDLVLTKMMRGDPQDLEDIGFLIKSDNITPEELEVAFKTARVPDENEILDLFQRAQPEVLDIAKKPAGREGRTTPGVRSQPKMDWDQSGPGSLG